jgi:cation diffusion facilitator family transporter
MAEEKRKREHSSSEMLAVAAQVSIWGAALSFLIAAVVGIMVDSVTLILEAAASLAILVSALLMHFSAQKIHTPPDEAFHYGYHKYETLTSVIQRGLIMVTCVISIKFAVQDIVHAEEVESYSLPAVAMFFSGLISLGIMLYLKWTAKHVHSQMIQASALHWLSDAVLTFGVCAGFVFGLWIHGSPYSGISPYVDPVMALILAGCLIVTPVQGLMRDLSELLDAAPPQEVRDKVQAVLEQYKSRVSGTHRVRTRKAGQKIFVEACFLAHETLTIGYVEKLAKEFERDLTVHFPDCDVIAHFRACR